MISSAAAQIEATAGQSIKTSNGLPDYGKVSSPLDPLRSDPDSILQVSIILIGIVAGLICIFCLFGPEELGAHFENGKAAFEVGSGLDEDIVHEGAADMEKATTHSSHDEEKGIKSQQESV
jgi:SHS family lactate transporter-like MFS transporter